MKWEWIVFGLAVLAVVVVAVFLGIRKARARKPARRAPAPVPMMKFDVESDSGARTSVETSVGNEYNPRYEGPRTSGNDASRFGELELPLLSPDASRREEQS